MQMPTDDELYRVDDVYLGPRGRSMPFRVRYRAYWVGGGIFLLLILTETATGLIGILPALYALVATVFATTKIMAHVDHERPVGALLKAAWQEISAPRPPREQPARTARFDVRRLHRRPYPPTAAPPGPPAADATPPQPSREGTRP